MLLLTELVAVNFTVPEMFESASADRLAVMTPLVGPLSWIEPAVSVMGIDSASALPAVSVASTTTLGGLVTAAPE